MTLFWLMEQYADIWKNISGSKPVNTFGDDEPDKEPEPVNINLETLIENFKLGYDHFGELWKTIVSKENFFAITELYYKPNDQFILNIDNWAKIVYDFGLAFHRWSKDRYKLVDTMSPLYYGQVASFVNATKNMTTAEAERIVEAQAEHFERMKCYLIDQWDK